MRFAIWPRPDRQWDEVLELARHCESTGWDGIYVADHFMPNTADGTPADGPNLECWAVIAGLATAVPRLRLGSLVCGNTYRHPAVLANIACSVDQVSGGRLVLGLGVGWQVNEHRAYGIALGAVEERLDWFEEACQVVTGLLRQRRTTVAGTRYQVTDAPCDPKPIGPLPLLLGGGGERRTMRIAARYADEWNIWSVPMVMREKLDVLRRHCTDLGRDPAEITVSTQALVYMSDDKSWLTDTRAAASGRPAVIGTPGEVAETIAAYRDLGVGEFIVPDWTMGSMARRKDTCDRFIFEVADQFR
ncbi:MAG: TIGR03560 family F420-dependent LLM class oxidoreductase [Acidimicrobiales bacterium]